MPSPGSEDTDSLNNERDISVGLPTWGGFMLTFAAAYLPLGGYFYTRTRFDEFWSDISPYLSVQDYVSYGVSHVVDALTEERVLWVVLALLVIVLLQWLIDFLRIGKERNTCFGRYQAWFDKHCLQKMRKFGLVFGLTVFVFLCVVQYKTFNLVADKDPIAPGLAIASILAAVSAIVVAHTVYRGEAMSFRMVVVSLFYLMVISLNSVWINAKLESKQVCGLQPVNVSFTGEIDDADVFGGKGLRLLVANPKFLFFLPSDYDCNSSVGNRRHGAEVVPIGQVLHIPT